jgi:hypothetical protein
MPDYFTPDMPDYFTAGQAQQSRAQPVTLADEETLRQTLDRRRAAEVTQQFGGSPDDVFQMIQRERAGQGPLATSGGAGFDPSAGLRITPIDVPAGAGAGSPMLQQQGAAPNPFEGYTPQQLAQPVTIGGASSSTTSTTPGVNLMPGYMGAVDKSYAAQQAAAESAAVAKQAQLTQQAAAMQGHQAALTERAAKSQEARSAQLAKVEELDKEAAKIRADIKRTTVDPERFMLTRSPLQIALMMLGVMGEEIAKGLAGHPAQGENRVLKMVSAQIDRDIAAQRANLETKKGSLADAKGAMADVYRRIGDLDQSEAQARILMQEQLQTNLQQIAARSQSDLVKTSAAENIALLDRANAMTKQQAYAASQPRITRSSTSTSQRVPLFKVLAAQAAAKTPQGSSLPPPSEKWRTGTWAPIQEFRREMAGFMTRYKKLALPTGVTSWYGSGAKADQLDSYRKLLLDKFTKAEVGAGFSSEQATALEGLLGRPFSSDEDLRARLQMIAHGLDNREDSLFEGQVGYANMAPLAARAVQNRKLVHAALRGKTGW